jgi:hypothetical protein
MDLFLAISQGIGVSLATGVRTFLVPLFVGAMARANAAIDFEHTGFEFLESVWWLALMLVLVIAAWLIDRSDVEIHDAAWVVLSMGFGALLFAGVLEDEDFFGTGGLIPGMLCALLGFAAAHAFFGGAAERLQARGEGAATIRTFGDLGAVVLAALAVLAPPVSYLAVGFCLWVLLARRRREAQKYEGLRILR